ncbi:thiolase family protein [Sphingomonas flavalba]|uniref:thiolase family protein n=1 Tax=Sphingomonas flavalba TaxID=2559804 RepID=UPI0039DFB6C1
MAENSGFLTGIGQSQTGVRLGRHPLLLTLDAIREALDDAGLTIADIDGISTYPGRLAAPPGFSPVGSEDLIDALRMKVRWYAGGMETSSQLGALVAAGAAVTGGLARHVLCFRTVYESTGLSQPDEYPAGTHDRVDGRAQWTAPFDALSPANWVAQYAMRHVHRFGLKREQLAQIAINAHANALCNPRAAIAAPLTLDAYLESRMISDPLCLYDCDRYTDASTVLIVSAGDALGEVRCRPVRIAASSYVSDRHSWDQSDWMAAYATGADLWKRTDYRPHDVDTVQLYDGFSFLVLTWLEGLGFCARGEGGPFVEGGTRIARDGDLPLNTFGGQLGAGRLHGFGFAHEAVVQLRGLGGARQIAGDPKVAIATSGGGPLATALLLTSEL